MTLSTRGLVALWMVLGLAAPLPLGGQEMPDPRQMSGVPLPVGDVQPGTVTVRVIRGSFANPIASLTVELVGAPRPVRATTNEAGRAEFSGLAPGLRLKAAATVAGETLESREFTVPAAGGIRLMLVAAEPDAAPRGAPSHLPAPGAPGQIVLGEESRFVFEMGEDGMSVFYVLQVLNRSGSAVEPEAPLVFDLPPAARSAALLEGSSPQAVVTGGQLRITGPFAPGSTIAQLAYSMPLSGPELLVEQKLPAALVHVAVVAQKIGDMELASPQMTDQRTMPAQGNLYIAGRGGAVPEGEVLRLHFTNVPHHATWPRDLAVALAVLVLAAGAWSAVRPDAGRREQAGQRRALEATRDRLFDELTALELRYREQRIDPETYAGHRRDLVSALERVYLALDDEVALGRAS